MGAQFVTGPPLAGTPRPGVIVSARLPLINIAGVSWQGQNFGLFENAQKHKVKDPITDTPILKNGAPVEIPSENFARGRLIDSPPIARPGAIAANQQAACCARKAKVKLLVDIRNPKLSDVKGTLTATPVLLDAQGKPVASALVSTSVAFESRQGSISTEIVLGEMPDKMGLYLLRVDWEATPTDSTKGFRFTKVTTEQHVMCIMGNSPLDPTRDNPTPISHTGTGTHHRLGKLSKVISKPTADASDVIWRIHEAVNNSSPPRFFNLLGVHLTHNGDVEKLFDGSKVIGTGIRLPLEDQWLMWVKSAGNPPFNHAACAGYVQLVKCMANVLGIPLKRKLLLPVTNQFPPAKKGDFFPPPKPLSELTLISDMVVAPGGLDVLPSSQRVKLKGLDGVTYNARIALMQDNQKGEFFEACSVTGRGKFLPGGFKTARVVATGATRFIANRGFNSAIETLRWWSQTKTSSGFQRFMCWIVLDDNGNLKFAWDVSGKAYAPADYVKIRDTGQQLPPP